MLFLEKTALVLVDGGMTVYPILCSEIKDILKCFEALTYLNSDSARILQNSEVFVISEIKLAQNVTGTESGRCLPLGTIVIFFYTAFDNPSTSQRIDTGVFSLNCPRKSVTDYIYFYDLANDRFRIYDCLTFQYRKVDSVINQLYASYLIGNIKPADKTKSLFAFDKFVFDGKSTEPLVKLTLYTGIRNGHAFEVRTEHISYTEFVTCILNQTINLSNPCRLKNQKYFTSKAFNSLLLVK